MVRSCGSCDSPRLGTGTYEGTHTCKTRGCPSCAWVRAKKVSEWMGEAFEFLNHPGHRWHMMVVTIPYDPRDPDDLEVKALRARARLAAKAVRYLWNHELKVEGAGAYRTIEVSEKGHVHANVLYFGPVTDSTVMESVVQTSALRGVGTIHVQDIAYAPAGKGKRIYSDDERGSREGLENAARYISKGVSHGAGHCDEDYLADQAFVSTVDPVLVARWEIATYRMHLTQKMGELRGLELEEDDGKPHEEIEDSHVSCECCGVVGDWRSKPVRADEYILDCHIAGTPALVTGAWEPRPPDD